MSDSSINRPFDPNDITPESQKKLNKIAKSLEKTLHADSERTLSLIREQFEIIEEENQRQLDYYPPNPPNDKCHNDLIKGILFSANAGFNTHDYVLFFSIEYETAYIWKHTDRYSPSLILDVNPSVTSLNVWKTISSLLN